MFATPAHLPKLLPWVDWADWAECKAGLFGNSLIASPQKSANDVTSRPLPLSFSSTPPSFSTVQLSRLQHSLDTIAVWRSRGRLPLSVDSTAQLLTVQRDDAAAGAVDPASLRQQYALCIIRLVNGLVDNSQRSTHALSIASLASSLHLPRLLVDVRHESTHSQLPSLPVLRYAAWEALRWLWVHYWQQQDSGTDTVKTNITRALQSWQNTAQAADEEERVRVVSKEMFATPAASAYLSSLLVSTLFPNSSTHCLSPPSAASITLSSPTDCAADVYFTSLLIEWQPLLIAVGKRLREFRVDTLRHTVTHLVAAAKQPPTRPLTDSSTKAAGDDSDGRHWRIQLLSRWSLHLIQSLSTREASITLYTHLASLCLLDTTGACHPLLRALMSRLAGLDDQAGSEWADVVSGEAEGDTMHDRQQQRKRKKTAQQSSTSEQRHDQPTLEDMRELADVELQHSAVDALQIARDDEESMASAADIELCEEWMPCPLGVLPHQNTPQLNDRAAVEQVSTQQSDGSSVMEGESREEVQHSVDSSKVAAQAVPLSVSGWDVPETDMMALRPWQAAIGALPEWKEPSAMQVANG